MTSLSERLYKWATQELNLASQAGFNDIPDEECFKSLTQGKQRRMWNYVINHVRSQSAVQKIKRILHLRKLLLEKESFDPVFEKESNDAIKLKLCVTQAEEKRQYLMRKLTSIENNILSIQQNIDKLNCEKEVIYRRTGVLELLRKRYGDRVSSVNITDKNLLSHINYMLAYQSCQTPNQSGSSLGYGILYDNPIVDQEKFQNHELIKLVTDIIEMKLSSKEIDKVYSETFQKNYQKLKDNGFLQTDLLWFLNSMSNSEEQRLSKVVLKSLSMNDFILQMEEDKTMKHLLSEMKYDNVHNSICILRNKLKIDHLQHCKKNICLEVKEQIISYASDPDLEYALLETSAQNAAFLIMNTSLEETLKDINGKAELVKQGCPENYVYDDIISLTKSFYKSADITFYLLNTAPATFAKLLDSLKNLQSFIQNETFQSYLPSDFLQGTKEKLLHDRKLMWEHYDKTKVVSPVKIEPYNIPCPLSPELKLLLVEPYEQINSACERLIELKNDLKDGAVFCVKPSVQNVIISSSTMYDTIMNMIGKTKVSIGDGEAYLTHERILLERYKNLIDEWWEQKAQFIPSIVYAGKSLKMWVDILHALDDFSPSHVQEA